MCFRVRVSGVWRDPISATATDLSLKKGLRFPLKSRGQKSGEHRYPRRELFGVRPAWVENLIHTGARSKIACHRPMNCSFGQVDSAFLVCPVSEISRQSHCSDVTMIKMMPVGRVARTQKRPAIFALILGLGLLVVPAFFVPRRALGRNSAVDAR